jgi:hypothetical protein
LGPEITSDTNVRYVKESQKNAGDKGGQKELSYRKASGRSIYDNHDTGRDKDAQGTPSTDCPTGKGLIELAF